MKAIAFDPDSRYDNAHELADEIQRFLDGEIVQTYEYSTLEKFARHLKRNIERWVIGISVLMVGLFVLIAVSLWANKLERQRADAEAQKAAESLKRAEAEEKEKIAVKQLYDRQQKRVLAFGHYARGMEYQQRGLFERAATAYQEATRADESFFIGFVAHGSALYNGLKFGKAIPVLEEAIALAKKDDLNPSEAHYLIADCYRRLRNLPDASRHYQLASQTDQDADRRLASRVWLLSLEEKHQEAMALISSVDISTVQFWELAFYKGKRLTDAVLKDKRLDQYDEALAALSRSIQLFPSGPALFNRGLLYANGGHREYFRAFRDFDRAIEIDSQNPRPYYHRAIMSLRFNQMPSAKQDLLRCRSIDPDFRSRDIQTLLDEIRRRGG